MGASRLGIADAIGAKVEGFRTGTSDFDSGQMTLAVFWLSVGGLSRPVGWSRQKELSLANNDLDLSRRMIFKAYARRCAMVANTVTCAPELKLEPEKKGSRNLEIDNPKLRVRDLFSRSRLASVLRAVEEAGERHEELLGMTPD
jgi:hypothetical protein